MHPDHNYVKYSHSRFFNVVFLFKFTRYKRLLERRYRDPEMVTRVANFVTWACRLVNDDEWMNTTWQEIFLSDAFQRHSHVPTNDATSSHRLHSIERVMRLWLIFIRCLVACQYIYKQRPPKSCDKGSKNSVNRSRRAWKRYWLYTAQSAAELWASDLWASHACVSWSKRR